MVVRKPPSCVPAEESQQGGAHLEPKASSHGGAEAQIVQAEFFTRAVVGTYRRLAPTHVREACRFEPSCSEYCLLAVAKYGFWKGWRMTLERLRRCRPPAGGVDFP